MEENVEEMPALIAEALQSGLIREPDDFNFRPVTSGYYYAQNKVIESRHKIIRAIEEIRQRHQFRRTLPFIEKMPQSIEYESAGTP